MIFYALYIIYINMCHSNSRTLLRGVVPHFDVRSICAIRRVTNICFFQEIIHKQVLGKVIEGFSTAFH